MSDRDQLHVIIDSLPPSQVQALLTLLAPAQGVSHDEFARRMAEAPEAEVDAETASMLLAAEAEPGENRPLSDIKRQLGL